MRTLLFRCLCLWSAVLAATLQDTQQCAKDGTCGPSVSSIISRANGVADTIRVANELNTSSAEFLSHVTAIRDSVRTCYVNVFTMSDQPVLIQLIHTDATGRKILEYLAANATAAGVPGRCAMTPLMFAMAAGNVPAVTALVAYNADHAVLDAIGQSAMDYGRMHLLHEGDVYWLVDPQGWGAPSPMADGLIQIGFSRALPRPGATTEAAGLGINARSLPT
jgi:hypothetical protein